MDFSAFEREMKDHFGDSDPEWDEVARRVHGLHSSFIAAGFTDKQAFSLLRLYVAYALAGAGGLH